MIKELNIQKEIKKDMNGSSSTVKTNYRELLREAVKNNPEALEFDEAQIRELIKKLAEQQGVKTGAVTLSQNNVKMVEKMAMEDAARKAATLSKAQQAAQRSTANRRGK